MINKVTLLGRIGGDPEIRTLESGTMVGKFGLATSESYRDRNNEWQEQTEWHDVVVWRTLAERAQQVLRKGTLLYVEGKLSHRKWQDKDGNPRKTTEVVASYFRIISRPDGNSNRGDSTEDSFGTSQAQPTPAAPATSPAPASAPAPTSAPATTATDDGDDLPF